MTRLALELVTFDVDQTLSDFRTVLAKALRAAAEALNPHLPRDISPDALQHRREAVAHRPGHQNLPMLRLRQISFEEVLGPGPDRDLVVQQALDAFTNVRFKQIPLIDGARDIINALHGRVALGWVTNGNSRPEHLGMAGMFGAVVLAEDVGARKPERAIFAHALQQVGVNNPQRWLHVGDHLHTDVLGAHRAGGLTVWFDDGSSSPDPAVRPNHRIASLPELANVLDQYDLQPPNPERFV